MTLTGHMLLSSLIGFVSFGFSMAAFIPAMGGNFAKRRISNHWGFIAVWIFADIVNVAGTIALGAQASQIITASWYSFADIVFGVQLVMYWNVSKSREKRKLRLYDGPRAKGRGGGCCAPATRLFLGNAFGEWSDWGFYVLLLACITIGVAIWGALFLLETYINPDYEVPIPEPSTLGFLLGGAANGLFASARFVELWQGWSNYRRPSDFQVAPSTDPGDTMFKTLIVENALQIVSIFILSDKPSYYEGQLPWIIGPALSIFFDMCLLASAIVWNKKWKKSNAFKAQDDPDGVVNRKRKHIKDAKRQLLLDEESLDEMIYDQAHANNAGLTEYKANKMASKNPKKSAKLHQKASKIRDEHTRYKSGVAAIPEDQARRAEQDAARRQDRSERHAVAGTRNRPRVVRVQARSKATGQGQATHLFSGTHP